MAQKFVYQSLYSKWIEWKTKNKEWKNELINNKNSIVHSSSSATVIAGRNVESIRKAAGD